jgi:DNA-cytosine methyltransferase
MLKVLELFSGTGCQVQALKNIGIECVSTQCEIDKYAIDTYNQLHGETPNLGDIAKVKLEDLKEGQFDLITYSSPCQDFSVAGLGRGGDKGSGTRSSLLFECEKIIRKVRPKYLLFENVKNLLSEKHVHNFMEWLKILEEMGYCNYYDVLNAKDFGIPQNRERIFCVSILGKHVPYVFPQKQPLKLRLKDMLEDRPNEKYYLSKKIQDRFVYNPIGKNIVGTTKGEENTRKGERDFCYSEDGVMGTLNATDYKQPKQVAIANDDGIEILGILDIKGFECCKRVYDKQGISPSITAGGGLQAHIIEPVICASRGRYNEQGKTEQQLEINKENTSNTITTVQKDNLVIEPKIERIGGMYGQATRWGVYSDEGISPTITASMGMGGGHVPMVEEKQERLSKQAYETLEENKCKDGDVINPFNKNVSPALRASNSSTTALDNNFRIRKLTPREAWRLMGWKDEQFDKIKGISNAQLYKMAGNGIVINVLEAIFANMFLRKPTKQEEKFMVEKPVVQMELF